MGLNTDRLWVNTDKLWVGSLVLGTKKAGELMLPAAVISGVLSVTRPTSFRVIVLQGG